MTATLDVQPVGDRMVRITRSFAAPRQLVFDARTRPELLPRWLGPATWAMSTCEIDLRPGGSFRYVMDGPDGARMVLGGTFREVDPPGGW